MSRLPVTARAGTIDSAAQLHPVAHTGTGVSRAHERAHPSRGGAAKPRDPSGQPGCRTEPRSHVLGRHALGRRAPASTSTSFTMVASRQARRLGLPPCPRRECRRSGAARVECRNVRATSRRRARRGGHAHPHGHGGAHTDCPTGAHTAGERHRYASPRTRSTGADSSSSASSPVRCT